MTIQWRAKVNNPIEFKDNKDVHFYTSKTYRMGSAVKILCLGEYVKSKQMGEYKIKGITYYKDGFTINGIPQTTTPHRVTCLECLKLLAPKVNRQNGKYVNAVIAAYELKINEILELKDER